MDQKNLTNLIKKIISNPSNLDEYYIINKVTYRQIYLLSMKIHKQLMEKCTPDEYVCIGTEKKHIIAASLLSSLAGGPGLILPYSHSRNVINEVYKSEKFSYLITDDSDKVDLPEGIEPLIVSHEKPKDCQTPSVLSRDIDKPFLKLFTGGSTGAPKVWTKTIRNIFSEAIYLSEKYSINSKDKFLATVPPYHIYGFLFSVVIPFISGSSVVEDMKTFPREIASGIEENCATYFISVPVHYRVMKTIPLKKHNLKMAFSSAGVLDKKDGSAFYEKTGIGVTEIYGSTETGGIAARNRSLGENYLTPFECIDWKIEESILTVKSDFISKELPVDDEGFFLTGDRVKKSGINQFDLLGRADGIVKVGGKRVDLSEVQNKIKSISGVADAYVISIPVQSGRENEIAAMIQSEASENEIRQNMAEMLEPYSMPKRIKIEKELPTLSTGKYNRKMIEKSFYK